MINLQPEPLAPPATSAAGPAADWALAGRAIQRLCEWPTLPIQALAGEVGLTPPAFSRVFRRMTGVSPKRFAHALQLIDARAVLPGSDSVFEAALACGLSGGGRLHALMVHYEAMTPGQYRAGGRGLEIRYGVHDSLFGEALIAMTPLGLAHLAFVAPGEPALVQLRARWPQALLRKAPAETAASLNEVLAGRPPTCAVHLQGSAFQLKVWQALLALPPGRRVSYSALARALGHPAAARATGHAVARNCLAMLVPCHQVLAASGALGGYRWGLPRKRALLALEAARAGSPGGPLGPP
jgi:AraC family transcriptional regulator of adaptative response/methylated-DNA-[protein]-cysteine methyltransferase